MDIEPFMRRAITLSHEKMDAGEGGPFGALVVRAVDGTVLAEGWNRVTSTADPTAHAEVVALRAAGQAIGTNDLSGTVLVASCEPCPMCLAAALWARVDAIYYANGRTDAAAIGFDDAYIYGQVCLPPDRRDIPMVRLLADEARPVFDAWQRKPDKIPY